MDNTKEIINALKKEKLGLSITDLVNRLNLGRGKIRTSLSFLLGAGLIVERQTGMAKLYFLEVRDEN